MSSTPISVLIVEDQTLQREELREFLEGSGIGAVYSEADALDSALEALEAKDLDLIFCDMLLPSKLGSADHSIEFGRQVYQSAVQFHPGAVRVFYSAFIDLDTIGDEVSVGATDDLYGDGVLRALTRPILKGSGHDPCLDVLREIDTGISNLDALDVDVQCEPDLDPMEVRALRLFASRKHGAGVRAEQLGGYSSSRALRVEVVDDKDRRVAHAFCKIGPTDDVEAERRSYDTHVANRLPHGSYAPRTSSIDSMVGRRRALVYDLADEFDRSLLDVAAAADDDASRVVEHLRVNLAHWTSDPRSFNLSDLRRMRVTDQQIAPFFDSHGLTEIAAEIEIMSFDASLGVQHGDLHGLNVLVDGSLRPLLIDYGDVSLHPVGLDPLTLELSITFLKNSPLRSSEWPQAGQLSRWFDLDQYLDECPCPAFVQACRQWLEDVCPREVIAALVWAHGARQYKYGVVEEAELAGLLHVAAGEIGDV